MLKMYFYIIMFWHYRPYISCWYSAEYIVKWLHLT